MTKISITINDDAAELETDEKFTSSEALVRLIESLAKSLGVHNS